MYYCIPLAKLFCSCFFKLLVPASHMCILILKIVPIVWYEAIFYVVHNVLARDVCVIFTVLNGLVQLRCSPIAYSLEFCALCTNSSICGWMWTLHRLNISLLASQIISNLTVCPNACSDKKQNKINKKNPSVLLMTGPLLRETTGGR